MTLGSGGPAIIAAASAGGLLAALTAEARCLAAAGVVCAGDFRLVGHLRIVPLFQGRKQVPFLLAFGAMAFFTVATALAFEGAVVQFRQWHLGLPQKLFGVATFLARSVCHVVLCFASRTIPGSAFWAHFGALRLRRYLNQIGKPNREDRFPFASEYVNAMYRI